MQGKHVIMVFLDCEGMNSWERLEIEDQLLALLSASLSSLTLLKTHFTFDRYQSDLEEASLPLSSADQCIAFWNQMLLTRTAPPSCSYDHSRCHRS